MFALFILIVSFCEQNQTMSLPRTVIALALLLRLTISLITVHLSQLVHQKEYQIASKPVYRVHGAVERQGIHLVSMSLKKVARLTGNAY